MRGLGTYGELARVGLLNRDTGLVHEGAARVPWLDDLAEDDLDLVRVVLLDAGDDRVVDGGEELLGELEVVCQ